VNIENWLREIEKWCPTLTYRSYYGGQAERLESQDEIKYNLKNIDIIVTTYNMATGNKDDRAFLRKLNCKSMILDEGRMFSWGLGIFFKKARTQPRAKK
jgi:SWI/SNF-related matrix-associated actin-dependent regulator 1 of chromatin subfamily A